VQARRSGMRFAVFDKREIDTARYAEEAERAGISIPDEEVQGEGDSRLGHSHSASDANAKD
jgi:hypothetical protein